jgi:DNA replicative helicase MCM subunit Mcm2 (Cdc46/Mcm family)
MEQQTISIAKAGITTILNSRTSVLAAANPSFGRYDDMKTAAEQIDFQTTILSRFDLIFVVKDSRVEIKDKRMAKHIMNLHMGIETAEQVGDIDVPVLKRYIEFCRTRVSPRLTVDACESLRNQFVSIRNEHRLKIREGSVIPITIRQLEAIVRLSESIARMSCTPDVTDAHVAEAFRLFRVSTLDAASTGLEIDGSAANDPNFVTKVRSLTPVSRPFFRAARRPHRGVLQVTEAEKWIRGRMAVGSSIPERVLMEASNRQVCRLAPCSVFHLWPFPAFCQFTAVAQGMQTSHVRKALQVMLNRGQLVVRAQGNLLTRAR